MKNKILLGLLSLLGFSRCIPGGDLVMYGPAPMYAPNPMPYFVVKGAVTDTDDKPLENIRIVLKAKDEGTNEKLKALRDTVYTDSEGLFETETRPDAPLPWALIAEDIDGEENGGEFATEEKIFHSGEETFDPEEDAYKIDFSLTKKEEDNEVE